MMNAQTFATETLSVPWRLAVSFAPQAAMLRWLGLLALDQRFAGILRGSREPMLAQIRLAWWREQLGAPVCSWPEGEPLLAALKGWGSNAAPLIALAHGWEGLVGAPPLGPEPFMHLAEARAQCFAQLAKQEVVREAVRRQALAWALADLAAHVSDEAEGAMLRGLVQGQDWSFTSLPREMRPLAVLHGMAARNLRRGRAANAVSPGTWLIAMRIGLAGR